MEVCDDERNILISETEQLTICVSMVYPWKNSAHSLAQAPSSEKTKISFHLTVRGPVFKSLFLSFSYFPFALSVDLFACLETYSLGSIESPTT